MARAICLPLFGLVLLPTWGMALEDDAVRSAPDAEQGVVRTRPIPDEEEPLAQLTLPRPPRAPAPPPRANRPSGPSGPATAPRSGAALSPLSDSPIPAADAGTCHVGQPEAPS
jgi:hypothetical protein